MNNSIIQEFDYLLKIIVVGDTETGKTSLVQRYTSKKYEDTISTIGVDLKIKSIKYRGSYIKLNIWDTAGQERFRALSSLYYKNADSVIIVFSLSSLTSFQNVDFWIQECGKYMDLSTHKVLVGTKCDLEHKVSKEMIEELINKYDNIDYIETSSKNNINIENVFIKAVEKSSRIRRDLETLRRNVDEEHDYIEIDTNFVKRIEEDERIQNYYENRSSKEIRLSDVFEKIKGTGRGWGCG